MFSNRERGSVLLADVLLGCVIVAVVASGATAAGLIVDAHQSSREAAREGAVALARGWEPTGAMARVENLALPVSTIEAATVDGRAVVTVSTAVSLPHPLRWRIETPVTATSSVPIAPYRSRRDG